MDKRYFPPFSWIYVLALVLALAVLGIGIYEVANAPGDWTMMAAGCLCVVMVFVTWPLSLSVYGARAGNRKDADEVVQQVTDRLDQMSILLNLMSEQQLLSDRAKSIAFRDKDQEALKRAISEEMSKQHWDAALLLVDDIERGYGNRAEADRYRQEILNRQQETVRKQIQEVVTVIDRHTRSEQWNGAMREADRLLGMFPDNETVRNLPAEIDARRQAHKKQLLDSWNEAVARHDVDGSIEILKQLDPYLTPAEGQTMQETARGVFKEKLKNLGDQFTAHVHEQRWAEAIRVGDVLMREFPNSRIAQEVREKMDLLKKRASEGPSSAPAAAGTSA